MNPINELKQIADGAAVITAWFGAGGRPVSQDTANTRALACLHGDKVMVCSFLGHPYWWESTKGAIASAIKEQLEAKGNLKLETALDQNPSMCRKCGCCLPLKVWTPIEHIKSQTTEEQVQGFPAFCWQRIEIENLSTH